MFGQFTVITVRYGDEPFPFIRFIRRSGPEIPQFLFAGKFRQKNRSVYQARRGLDTANEISISVKPGQVVSHNARQDAIRSQRLGPKRWRALLFWEG